MTTGRGAVESYCDQKFDEIFWNGTFQEHEKVEAANILREGYKLIANVAAREHETITPKAVAHINILEGFLITFVQHSYSYKHVQKLEAVIG
jgi:precorrin-6B methylase 2